MDGNLAASITTAAQENPLVAGAALLVALLILVFAARRAAPRAKDPTRLFTNNQRMEGFARAGGRCELEMFPFLRCKKPASHGDHHFPWSKGGSTSMGNFTAACMRCNTSKGAKVPGLWSTIRMEARRRRYFPAGSPTKAGERFTQR